VITPSTGLDEAAEVALISMGFDAALQHLGGLPSTCWSTRPMPSGDAFVQVDTQQYMQMIRDTWGMR